MLGRQNVYAIVQEIIKNLDHYLHSHPYHIISESGLKKNCNNKGTLYSCLCDDKNYMVFTEEVPDRITLLTLSRMANLYNIRCALEKQLIDLDESKQVESSQIDNIHKLLVTGVETNKKLSIKYGVVHISYNDARLAGHGVFASWYMATSTQSRAESALVKSISAIDDVKCKFKLQDSLPCPSAPPLVYAFAVATDDESESVLPLARPVKLK